MRHTRVAVAAVIFAAATVAYGNGGPFIVKYPGGDPAAKGVLARLDPSLMPARETRLKVVKEDLTIAVGVRGFAAKDMPPLAGVSAVYTIENPTNEKVEMDFGFPIVRGIYMEPFSMTPRPDVLVQLDGERVNTTVISNSSIYGLIRQQARETIERAIAADAKLAALVQAVPRVAPKPVPLPPTADGKPAEAAPPAGPALNDAAVQNARRELAAYLTTTLKWNAREAALLVEYAACDFGKLNEYPPDRWMWGSGRADDLGKLARENLGFLGAIGEQRMTQLFAVLAAKFDPKVAAAYETIFQAWGGDVRERSLDLKDGKLRPREIELEAAAKAGTASRALGGDPTVYARVDYLDQNQQLSDDEKTACRAVLKNLPVVFTFAPMNLLYYRVEFPPKATRVVAVSYKQFCALDTKAPQSYQLGYVLHPASLWDTFGPINLKVVAPQGATIRATAALKREPPTTAPTAQQAAPAKPAADFAATLDTHAAGPFAVPVPTIAGPADVYTALLTEAKHKTGELYIAVEKAAFEAPPAKE